MKKLSQFLAVAALAGCAAQSQPLVQSYSDQAAASCNGTGTGSIEGQAFLRTVGGDVRYAAGERVMLVARTPYAREVIGRRVYGVPSPSVDQRLASHARTTQADGEGRFTFTDLPACHYIVTTQVYWAIPVGYMNDTQGGVLSREITLDNGETENIVLTR